MSMPASAMAPSRRFLRSSWIMGGSCGFRSLHDSCSLRRQGVDKLGVIPSPLRGERVRVRGFKDSRETVPPHPSPLPRGERESYRDRRTVIDSHLQINAIVFHRRRLRHHALRDIARDRLARAFVRMAKAAAAGGQERHDIAGVDLHFSALEDVLLGAVGTTDDGIIGGGGSAAMEPPGRVYGALAIDIGATRLQQPICYFETEAAASAARATGIDAKGVAVDQHRIFDLLEFDRRIAHVALADGYARRFAVF